MREITGFEMTCRYCGTRNADGEHRCTRCGRRPGDTLTPTAPVITGAVAAKLEPLPQSENQAGLKTRRVAPALRQPIQTELFAAAPDSKVVSIARYAPQVAPKPRTKADSGTRTGAPKPATRKSKPAPEGQGTLDFLPPLPPKARELGSSVEAVIFCEFPVATTLHRAVAAALDWSMVLIGYGLFLGGIHLLGCEFALNKSTLAIFGATFFLVGFIYGLCFAIAGADTPGMTWTRLRLTTFDGLPPELRQRLGRFTAASLSRCTLLGLLWSLVDEESLTWHDHMSRTFPTPRDAEHVAFRRR
jgi:uncharacterized RDD family membrane protein YckC